MRCIFVTPDYRVAILDLELGLVAELDELHRRRQDHGAHRGGILTQRDVPDYDAFESDVAELVGRYWGKQLAPELDIMTEAAPFFAQSQRRRRAGSRRGRGMTYLWFNYLKLLWF